MKTKLLMITLVAGTFALLSTDVSAVPIPGLFNTGVNNAGSPLPNGTIDPHWVLSSGPAGTPTAITGNPIPGSWVSNTATSRWVTPGTNGLFPVTGGTYLYDLTFDLTGFQPATATISGIWSSDNQSSVLLNGVPFATHSGGAVSFNSFDSFGTSTGFLPGINTLRIQVNNLGGPSGAHVNELQGDALPIPEPCTITLAVLALGGIFMRRKCRSARQ
jgi:hypothetical protein